MLPRAALRALYFAVSVSLWAPFTPARAADDAALIVFDGSGSMWGQLGAEKVQKLYVARDAVKDAVTKSKTRGPLGMLVFGGRRKGDCSDVDVVEPLQAGNTEGINGALDKVNPKGKGPLGLALREAHQLLLARDNPPARSSIIVVHDGPDNCGQDLCAIAGEIAKSPAKPRIHVITLGLDKVEAENLSCVSRLTRGKHFVVNDLTSARESIAEAFVLANLDQGQPSAEAASNETEASSPSPTDATGPPRVRLYASLASGGPAIKDAVRWRIFKDSDPDTVVIDRVAAELKQPLDAGSYQVEARYGLVITRGPLKVADAGITALGVPFNAGWIDISAKAARTGEALQDALFTVTHKADTGAQDKPGREPFWVGRGEHRILVPAGTYFVGLDAGLVHSEQTVKLAAGGRAVTEFTSSLGQLSLSSVAAEGGPALREVSYVISGDDPESPLGRREIVRSSHPEPAFGLPAGTYYITAHSGKSEARERVALGPGDLVKTTLNFAMTQLEVSASVESGPLPAGVGVLHRVMALGASSHEIARSTSPTATFSLASGRYRIETQIGSHNALAVSDVELLPGKDAKITQSLQAGRVTITSAPAASTKVAGYGAWELRDARGQFVLRAGSDPSKTAVLAPGGYTIRNETAEQLEVRAFELKAGDQLTLDLAHP